MDLQHLRASDGTGEAVLAHIQTNRTAGSTVLDLDNVDNWNSKCVVVTGTPAANGFISPVGMKVMYGHLNAGDFIIDGYAPGYTDNGNTTAEVAIVKMTTSWADTLISLLGNALADTGFLKTTSLDHFFKPSELVSDFVASGGVVAQSAGLTGTFSNIVFYISGLRYTKNSVANKTYTASKDTYVDIDNTGTVYYTEVANGAAEPALTAGRIRIAKVVTNGSAITSVTDLPRRYAIDDNNYPSFRATYANASAPGGGFTPLFNTIQHNIGSAYNPSTGIFTAPVKGLYTFSYHCHAINMTRMFCTLSAGGQVDRSGEASMGAGTEWAQSGSMTILLNAGQTANCSFWFSGTSNVMNSHFDGYLIRKMP